MKNLSFKSVLKGVNSHLARVLVPWIIRHPKYLVASRCLVRGYRRSLELIDAAMLEDLQVPPFLILSITNNCNLHCSGCYAAAVGTLESTTGSNKKKALNTEQWHKIIDEAIDLGVFGFIIAGGEPFLFPDLLDLIEEHNSNFFLIFSNGTAIKKSHYARLKKLANVGVIVSVEGGQFLTDNRRGEGVYAKALKTILQLKKQGTLSGISVTINKLNYEYWLDPENIDNLISDGVRLGFFMEYIPSSSNNKCTMEKLFEWDTTNDTELMLSEEERAAFREQILNYRNEKKILLVHSPGDEDLMGGCVSAGRGFAHVTPYGDLTPCPVSDITTHNLKHSNLREGLESQLFTLIRENEHLLETGETPCALYAHPKEVEMLVKEVGAKHA